MKLGKGYSVMVSEKLAISIGAAIGVRLRLRPAERVHGGSINECYRWDTATYRPPPALLHGDLWGVNRLTDDRARPVIFDAPFTTETVKLTSR